VLVIYHGVHKIREHPTEVQGAGKAKPTISGRKKSYLHESRHNHAMRRPRGPGGRFLIADEVAKIERTKERNRTCMKADINITLNSMRRVGHGL
jgi:hypothetical protein